jgi:hypothetical protein
MLNIMKDPSSYTQSPPLLAAVLLFAFQVSMLP